MGDKGMTGWSVTAGGAAALALGLAAMGAATGAAAQERRVEEIHYVTCDGSQWSATLDGDRFWHFPRDPDAQAERHESRNIRYRTWGGGCWDATWDARSRTFFHTPMAGGAGHPDTILNYEDWSGVRWTARRNRDDWIVRRP